MAEADVPTPAGRRLHVWMRSHGAENRKNRPDFYDKTTCLASVVRAAEVAGAAGAACSLTFLNDGPIPPARQRLMLTAGEVLLGSYGSNRRSYRAMLDMAADRVGDDDLVWFAEDDYLYLPDAFEQLLAAAASMPDADYFSMYLGEVTKRQSRPPVGRWGPAVSTTSSFGVRGRQLREDLRLLRLMPYTGGAFDHTTSLTLQGRWPFDALELLDDLVPVRQPPATWPRAMARGTTRLVLGLRSARRPSRRRRLVQPSSDLIAHLETGAFDTDQDWAAVAADVDAWASRRDVGPIHHPGRT